MKKILKILMPICSTMVLTTSTSIMVACSKTQELALTWNERKNRLDTKFKVDVDDTYLFNIDYSNVPELNKGETPKFVFYYEEPNSVNFDTVRVQYRYPDTMQNFSELERDKSFNVGLNHETNWPQIEITSQYISEHLEEMKNTN